MDRREWIEPPSEEWQREHPNWDKPTRKPTISIVAGQLSELATLAEDRIIGAGLAVYQRGRRLVRPAAQEVAVSKGRTILSTCFAELGTSAMLDFMGRSACWARYDARTKQQVAKDPPRPVAEVLLSRFGDWRFPPVSGVITTPTLRPIIQSFPHRATIPPPGSTLSKTLSWSCRRSLHIRRATRPWMP